VVHHRMMAGSYYICKAAASLESEAAGTVHARFADPLPPWR